MSTDEEMMSLKSKCVAPLLNCPKGERHADCPFAPIRKVEIVESIHWLKKRSIQELRAILDHHRRCSTQSESVKPTLGSAQADRTEGKGASSGKISAIQGPVDDSAT